MDAERPYDLVYNIDPFFEQQQHLWNSKSLLILGKSVACFTGRKFFPSSLVATTATACINLQTKLNKLFSPFPHLNTLEEEEAEEEKSSFTC